MNPQDFDICECGDYRHQHAEKWRACEVCTEDDGMNGRECLMFRIHQTCHVKWKKVRR